MIRPVPPKRLVTPLLALAILVGAAAPAAAFDTGHHFDLTASVLKAKGLGDAAVRQAQVANWISDYLNTPVYPDRTLARQFDLMHFDDLADDEAVRIRWAGTVRNTRRVVQDAARRGDAEGVLTALGMTLHAVQDFYSHSNWVELHPREPGGPYRATTYFRDAAPPGPMRTSLDPKRASHVDLAHGDYFKGMNKDSHVRQGWDEAYLFAHAATDEWAEAVKGWTEAARPGFWAACEAWRPDAATRRDLRKQLVAAQRLSSWGSAGFMSDLAFFRRLVPTGADGHWKGNGSGDFVATLLASLTGPSPRASAVAARAIELVPHLVEGLKAPGPQDAFAPALTAMAEAAGLAAPAPGQRAIVVRTLGVRALEGGLDPASPPDFFCRVEVAGQRFLEAPQIDRAAITPAWTAIAVVPADDRRVPIAYALTDEDYPDVDDPVALTAGGKLRFWFEPASGRVGGLPPGATAEPLPGGAVVTVRGAAAEVRLRVTSARLAPEGGRLEIREAGI